MLTGFSRPRSYGGLRPALRVRWDRRPAHPGPWKAAGRGTGEPSQAVPHVH